MAMLCHSGMLISIFSVSLICCNFILRITVHVVETLQNIHHSHCSYPFSATRFPHGACQQLLIIRFAPMANIHLAVKISLQNSKSLAALQRRARGEAKRTGFREGCEVNNHSEPGRCIATNTQHVHNMSGIPIIESAWGTFLSFFTEYQLKTVVTFLIHEFFYWTSYIPFIIADRIPYLNRYKIQPEKQNTTSLHKNCVKRLILSHFLLVLPMIMLSHPIFDHMGSDYTVQTIPPLQTLLSQVILFFLIEDFVFYWGHRALHTPWLYKHIHSIHHEHAAPFGIAAEYAHPIEIMFLGLATLVGPMLIGPHLLTLYTYLALRCIQTVECHSGYDFPCSLNRWFPLYGGADFHDHHHRIHSGNYSSTFIWVDRLHGTDTAYQHWKRKQRVKTT